jgi:hypothetical protein
MSQGHTLSSHSVHAHSGAIQQGFGHMIIEKVYLVK